MEQLPRKESRGDSAQEWCLKILHCFSYVLIVLLPTVASTQALKCKVPVCLGGSKKGKTLGGHVSLFDTLYHSR